MHADVIDVEFREVTNTQEVNPVDFASLSIFPAAQAVADAFKATEPLPAEYVTGCVETLLAEMLQNGLKAELPVSHFHSDGTYARELFLPKGTFAIGQIQKRPHISVISKGEISMLNETGGITRIKAPCTIVSKPGVRKIGFAHEDTVWVTVHNMAECDIESPETAPIEALEDFLTVSTFEEHALFLESQKQKMLENKQ
jgi:hypothetical protein